MIGTAVVEPIWLKYEAFTPYLNEQTRRVWAAIEAQSLGHGSISAVSQATRLQRDKERWRKRQKVQLLLEEEFANPVGA